MPTKLRPLAAIAALALIAACGGDTADSTTTTSSVETTTTTAAETTTTAAAETTTSSVGTTTVSPAEPIVPGEDPDVDEIVAVYAAAFDSTTSFEEKAAVIDGADGLEETVASYATTGETMGGVTTQVDAVSIDGDTASVTYTLMFAGNPTYPGLQGDAIRTAEGWKISREMFCGIMTSARVGCPAE